MRYSHSNELYHHGIKGQKWGVRRWQYKDGSLTPEGYPHYGYGKRSNKISGVYNLNTQEQEQRHNQERRTEALKKAYIPGYKLIKKIENRRLFNDKTDYVKKDGEYETVESLKTKVPPNSADEAVKIINPRKDKPGGVYNCVACAMAMDMQCRGYDVDARGFTYGVTTTELMHAYKNAKLTPIKNDYAPKIVELLSTAERHEYMEHAYNNICNELESQGNGARGMLCLTFRNNFGGGHCMFYEVKNDRAYIYDAQSGETYNKTDDIDSVNPFIYTDPSYTDYIRTDSLDLNEDIVCEYVKSRK